jgi:Glycosyl transferase family 2
VIRASVIVPARDAEATLPRTLAAIADQEGAPSFEVVVADHGSRDGTAAIVERAGARLVRPAGAGPGEARDAAVAVSSGALLAFCSADCFPSAGWLAAGARALADAELVQGRVLPDPRAEVGPFDKAPQVAREDGLYDAANLFTTRTLFDRVGGFEPAPKSGLLDEAVWFGWRARGAGARTTFCAEALSHRTVRNREVPQYLEERTRLRDLPEAVARLPELRDTLLHRRLFLSRRTMKLDLALAAFAAATARRSALPLLAAAPYALDLHRHARGRAGEDWLKVAAVDAAADLLGLLALAHGIVAARTVVL